MVLRFIIGWLFFCVQWYGLNWGVENLLWKFLINTFVLGTSVLSAWNYKWVHDKSLDLQLLNYCVWLIYISKEEGRASIISCLKWICVPLLFTLSLTLEENLDTACHSFLLSQFDCRWAIFFPLLFTLTLEENLETACHSFLLSQFDCRWAAIAGKPSDPQPGWKSHWQVR